MTGETVASMTAAVSHMAPALLGRAAGDFAVASAAMDAAMYGNTGAKAAIDIALHDLVARAGGQPLHALFGAKARSRMPVLAVIGSTDEDADLREAKERFDAGYRAFKIKVGIAAPEADGARTRAVCRMLKASGEGCLVSADANQGFTVEEATRLLLRSAMRGSISSSSRYAPTIWLAWRAWPPQAACPLAPMKASIRSTISSVIMRARRRRA